MINRSMLWKTWGRHLDIYHTWSSSRPFGIPLSSSLYLISCWQKPVYNLLYFLLEQSGLMDDGTKLSLLGVWMALFVVFAARKFQQPIKVLFPITYFQNMHICFLLPSTTNDTFPIPFCLFRMISVTNQYSCSMHYQRRKRRHCFRNLIRS